MLASVLADTGIDIGGATGILVVIVLVLALIALLLYILRR